FVTGINATKIIRNLQIVHSFCCGNLVARERKHLASDLFPFSLFLLFRFGFLNWVRCKPVGPRRGDGADGSRSLCASSTHARNPAMGPESKSWVPICASIWDQNPKLGPSSPGDRVAVHRDLLSGLLGAIQHVGALCW